MPGTIVFINESSFEASINALDENGNETEIAVIGPGEESQQETEDGQRWVVKNSANGSVLKEVVGTNGYQECTILTPRSGPDSTGQ